VSVYKASAAEALSLLLRALLLATVLVCGCLRLSFTKNGAMGYWLYGERVVKEVIWV